MRQPAADASGPFLARHCAVNANVILPLSLMPCNYKQYPADWKERRARILARAGQVLNADGKTVAIQACCEGCGLENALLGWRLSTGRWLTPDQHASDYLTENEEDAAEVALKKPAYRVILTVAHLDHDPSNKEVSDERLKALCQKCHLDYDRPHHLKNAAETRRRKAGLANLFQ
jgi:hypothetical protein